MKQKQCAAFVSILTVGLLLATHFKAEAATTELKPDLAPLAYFLGDWDCSGKFDASGKAINAHQHFAPELDGAWLTFRHDDTPPFNYHALSEWGWDSTHKKFVMTVQDNFGGVRVFYSAGWNSTQLQWDGDAVGNASNPAQRFSFDRVDDRHFKVSYFTLKNNAWSRMDSSTCIKQ
jgi:hypothetical protein